MKHTLIAAIALGLPGLAMAHDFAVGDLKVMHPMAFETPPTAKSGAGYLMIVNEGDTADALIEVRADFPKVMLHKSEEKDGIATMSHVHKIEIPAGGSVELAPGGFHVMFMGLNGDPLEDGETFDATLVFENAGEVDVVFNVEPRTGGGDHSGHGDHSH